MPAFNLDGDPRLPQGRRRWKPKVYHNLPTRDGSDDGAEQAWRVAMRSSAAPTYFPSFDGFADGGVFANNPAMCALAQTRDARLARAIPPESVSMLSLGTGFNASHLDGDNDWGALQWGRNLTGLLMDGVNDVADFQVRQMLARALFAGVRAAGRADRPGRCRPDGADGNHRRAGRSGRGGPLRRRLAARRRAIAASHSPGLAAA
ncbi:Patatin [Chromobacterium violaceum]|uniref:Patatin n=1 Tax=Chromobacterium violaceum TaxID=536 RepID=A0A447T5N2_CHRVL|nr:Patatin [Chromobacterium violaceum]